MAFVAIVYTDQDTLLISHSRRPAVKKSQIREYLSVSFLQYFFKAFAAEPTAATDKRRKATSEMGLIRVE